MLQPSGSRGKYEIKKGLLRLQRQQTTHIGEQNNSVEPFAWVISNVLIFN